MHTVVYMSESGELSELKVNSLEEARAFCKELSTKNIPMKKFEDFKPKKMKTRSEELDILLCEHEIWSKIVDACKLDESEINDFKEALDSYVKLAVAKDRIERA